MTDHITIPISVVEDASRALGNFVMDHGWSDSDMQAMDNLDAYIARHRANQAARAELAKPTNADPECAESTVDYWQQRGHLGSPGEWREACRLFRVRCSPEDIQRMAKLRAYIEDGLLIVSRPDNKPPTPAQHDAPIRAYRLTLELDADMLSDMASALMNLSLRADRGELTRGVSGGPDSGYIYELLHDPAQTHETYFSQVREYLARKKAKAKGGAA